MLYYELLSISLLVLSLISVPYVCIVILLCHSRISFLQKISVKESVLIGFIVGQFFITIPASVLSTINSFDIEIYHYVILGISIISPLGCLILYRKRVATRLYPQTISRESTKTHDITRANNFDRMDSSFRLKEISEKFVHVIKNPANSFLIFLILFYGYILLIIPVDNSFDAVNYILPYSQGILELGHIPADPFKAHEFLGGVPNTPPALAILYSYALNLFPDTDSFKLFPLLFLIQLALAGALLGKEIVSRINPSWIMIIFLVLPPVFIYFSTTPYNADLVFYSYFISAILFIVKAKRSSNVLWSFLAGASIALMLLTRDIGLIFILPLLSIILLGNKKIGKLWIAPLSLQILIPLITLSNTELKDFFFEHATSLIILQILLLGLSYFIAKRVSFEHNLRIVPSLITIIPAAVFIAWNTHVWGFPIMRTQIGALFTSTRIDYSWASDIAMRELGSLALAVKPVTSMDLLLSLGYLFFIPALGGLLFFPKIIGVIKCVTDKTSPKILVVLLLILVINWVSIFGGIDYNDMSTFRHTLDVTIILSIIAVFGIMIMLPSKNEHKNVELLFVITMAIIFMVHLVTYLEYNSSTFTLKSRTITDDPFIIRFIIYSAGISILLLSRFFAKIPKQYLFAVLIIIAGFSVYSIVSETTSVIASEGGDYELTNKKVLTNLRWYEKMISVHNFFNSNYEEGNILACGIDSLDYRTSWHVLEMRSVLDLALLKPYLTGEDVENTVQNMKSKKIKYIVIPKFSDAGNRCEKLYRNTMLYDVLESPHVRLEAQFQNLFIYRLT